MATRMGRLEPLPGAVRNCMRLRDLACELPFDCVNLKHPLRQIETNPRDSRQIPNRLAHGRLPFRYGSTTTILAR